MIKKIFWRTITIIGIGILFWIGSLILESRTELNWPQTKGQVLSSLLTIDHLPKFVDFNPDRIRWYGVDVQYEYVVDGTSYISNRLAIHDSETRSPKTALRKMNKYRQKHEVVVFYNPANPQQAVLEPANIGDILLPLLVGLLLAFLWPFVSYDQPIKIKQIGEDTHFYWGNIYQKRGEFDEALNEFNKVIEISPNLVKGYKGRGGLYLQLGKWDEAIADFNQTILFDQTDAFIYFCRAQAYLGKKQYNKAWEDSQKAMEKGYKVKPEILEEIKKGL